MKTILSSIVTLLIIQLCIAQDTAISQRFLETKTMRVGASIGFDLGGNGLTSVSGNEIAPNITDTRNFNGDLGIDIYSPQSMLGFYTGLSLNTRDIAIDFPNTTARDSLNVTNLEIPLYAKLRLGKANRAHFAWLAAGGGYSFNLKAERTTIGINELIVTTDDSKEQFNASPFISFMVGYELILPLGKNKENKDIYDRDDLRLLFYAKYQRDLSTRLNPDYNYSTTTITGNYLNPEARFSSITFGLKIFFRLTKLKNVIN